MTTLTRTRTHETYGEYGVTLLAVTGPHGATATRVVTDSGYLASVSVAYCTPTELPGLHLTDSCPIHGGTCWGDAYGGPVHAAVADAWRRGGDEYAFAALEELYRREFSA